MVALFKPQTFVKRRENNSASSDRNATHMGNGKWETCNVQQSNNQRTQRVNTSWLT